MGVFVTPRDVGFVELGETLTLPIGVDDSIGNGANPTSPIIRVVDCNDVVSGAGAASTAVYSSTPTILTGLKQADNTTTLTGALIAIIPVTTANGFAINQTYAVFFSGTVGTALPTGAIYFFKT